jgi:hypothetical protein
MRIHKTALLVLGCIFSLALLSNKNGRASSQGKGNTGAPGDELNSNGTPKTCVNCHNSGPITATVGITLLKPNGDTVTNYAPNTDYILRVDVNGTGTIQGYGFQMIGLRNSDSTDVKGMSDFGGVTSNNYKIATIQNGRTYAEHANTSQKDTFNVRWKSPVAGTGAITFYAAGNAVNGNNGTGGDGAAFSKLVLPEEGTTSTHALGQVSSLQVRVFPNPIVDDMRVLFNAPESGTYQLRLNSLDGRLLMEERRYLSPGAQTLDLSLGNVPRGTHFLTIDSGKHRGSVKVVKI